MPDDKDKPVGAEEEERRFLLGRWVTKAEVDELLREMAEGGVLEVVGERDGKPVYRVPRH